MWYHFFVVRCPYSQVRGREKFCFRIFFSRVFPLNPYFSKQEYRRDISRPPPSGGNPGLLRGILRFVNSARNLEFLNRVSEKKFTKISRFFFNFAFSRRRSIAVTFRDRHPPEGTLGYCVVLSVLLSASATKSYSITCAGKNAKKRLA